MKTKYRPVETLQCRLAALACVLCSLSLVADASAQQAPSKEKAAAAETPAAKDPFAKKASASGGAKEKNAGDASEKSQTFQNIVHVAEFIEVPSAEVRKWLKANPGSPDGNAMRAEVQKWIDEGMGEVIASQMVVGTSGQRAKVESIRELIYPTHFDPIRWMPAAPSPTVFETRNLGNTFEVDGVIDADASTVDVNLAPEYVERVGEISQRSEPEGTVQEGDLRMPIIHVTRATLKTSLNSGDWRLISIESAGSGNDKSAGSVLNSERDVLVFIRSEIGGFSVPQSDQEARHGYVQMEWIDVPVESATAWMSREGLAQWSAEADGARSAVDALVEQREAKVVFTRLLPFQSGQRMKSESLREIMYATEINESEQNAPSGPRAIETRNVGVTLELDPVFHFGGDAVELNLASENVRLVDHNVLQRYFDLVDQEWKPDVLMPVFYTERVTTQATLATNQPTLVSMTMPNNEQGQPDRTRRRLLFFTITR